MLEQHRELQRKMLVDHQRPKLKIAVIAPPWLPTYPGCYYGIENYVHYLTSTLTEQGHHVELFTVGGTTTLATRRHWYFKEGQYKYITRPWHEVAGIVITHVLYSLNLIREIGGFDIIHDHNTFMGPAIMAYANSDGFPPILHTFHDSFIHTLHPTEDVPDNRLMYTQFKPIKQVYFNGISNIQLKGAPIELRNNLKGAIHNGINPADYPFLAQKQDYFISVARISRDKGQAVGARLCAELGANYKMAGTVSSSITSWGQLRQELAKSTSNFEEDEDFLYFRDEVAQWLVPDHIEYVGAVFGKRKLELFSNAKAFLFPIGWEEPFGMAVIDALACGTPVIAFRRGAMPEIIEHGVNGFLAENEDEFKQYMTRVGDIDPVACRQSVEKRFSAKAMTDSYVRLYREIIDGNSKI